MEVLSDKIIAMPAGAEVQMNVVWVLEIKKAIEDIKDMISGTATHGEGCRCPVKMNRFAEKQILDFIDKRLGDALCVLSETGGKE